MLVGSNLLDDEDARCSGGSDEGVGEGWGVLLSCLTPVQSRPSLTTEPAVLPDPPHIFSLLQTHTSSLLLAHTHTALLTQSLSLSLPTSPSFGRRSASARTHFTLGTAPVHSPALNLVSCGAARRVRSRYAPACAQSEHRQSGTMTERCQRGKQGEKRNY